MDDIEKIFNQGHEYHKQGNFDKAKEKYIEVLKKEPRHINSLYLLGTLYFTQGKINPATQLLQQVLKENPKHPGANNNLGYIYQGAGNITLAEKYYLTAIENQSNFYLAHLNLGNIYYIQGKLDKEEQCFRKAIEINPSIESAYNSLGIALIDQRRLAEAEECVRQALKINPNFAMAHFNRAIILALKGKLKEAWKEFEWRELHSDRPIIKIKGIQRWDGEDLKNKKVLLVAEQGVGDNIQFIRYFPLFKKIVKEIGFIAPASMIPLIEKMPSIDLLYDISEKDKIDKEKYNYYMPIMTLPLVFNTDLKTIPNQVPYIDIPEMYLRQWESYFKKDAKFKIGIVWAGGAKHKNDINRSCQASDFNQILDLVGASFYSLQMGAAKDQLKNLKDKRIVDLSDKLNDFAQTAAVISHLDLVITVDTSVAHLAGALAKPVWALLSCNSDWRWLLTGDKSAWYPTMRLYRQKKHRQWNDVFDKIKDDLKKIIP